MLGRFRYFDIPAQYQNKFKGSNIDAGLQFEFNIDHNLPYQLELMSDPDGNYYLNNHLRHQIDLGDFDFDSRVTLRLKSSGFNDRYYGLAWLTNPDTGKPIGNNIGSDYDITIGSKVRYHVWRNFYLLGEANLTRLGQKTYHSPLIYSPTQGELFVGLGIFNDKKRTKPLKLPYLTSKQ